MAGYPLAAVWLATLFACWLGQVGCEGRPSSTDDAGPSDAVTADAALLDGALHTDGGDGGPPRSLHLGILQFDLRHNLQDDSCVARDDCFLSVENSDDPAGWLARIATYSDLAVLHWDRAVPWLVFDAELPAGADRLAFYDSRLDPSLLGWIDAFAAHFAASAHRYLAVTPLNGLRNGISPARVASTDDIAVSSGCTTLAPGTQVQFTYDIGEGQQQATFDLQRAYTNFVLYLYDKLQPDYLALIVEANLFKLSCPQHWPGLVALYRAVYDAVHAEAGTTFKVFATLSFKELLAFDLDGCAQRQVEACTGVPSPPDYPTPDPLACYPLDLTAITDLDQGDRLDILALSFYPDALAMAVGEENLLRIYPNDWDGSAPCAVRVYDIPFVDPFSALDRFGWQKPIAMAELGARSCTTLAYSQDGNTPMILAPTADSTSEAFWMEHALGAAEQRHFEFYVQSFLRDYQPIGLWTVEMGLLDPPMLSVFNTFACMGLFDDQDQPKTQVMASWETHQP